MVRHSGRTEHVRIGSSATVYALRRSTTMEKNEAFQLVTGQILPAAIQPEPERPERYAIGNVVYHSAKPTIVSWRKQNWPSSDGAGLIAGSETLSLCSGLRCWKRGVDWGHSLVHSGARILLRLTGSPPSTVAAKCMFRRHPPNHVQSSGHSGLNIG